MAISFVIYFSKKKECTQTNFHRVSLCTLSFLKKKVSRICPKNGYLFCIFVFKTKECTQTNFHRVSLCTLSFKKENKSPEYAWKMAISFAVFFQQKKEWFWDFYINRCSSKNKDTLFLQNWKISIVRDFMAIFVFFTFIRNMGKNDSGGCNFEPCAQLQLAINQWIFIQFCSFLDTM